MRLVLLLAVIGVSGSVCADDSCQTNVGDASSGGALLQVRAQQTREKAEVDMIEEDSVKQERNMEEEIEKQEDEHNVAAYEKGTEEDEEIAERAAADLELLTQERQQKEGEVHKMEPHRSRCWLDCARSGNMNNDPSTGSDQVLSCSQACMIRARGSTKSECKSHCNRNGGSGCSLKVKAFTYSMCAARRDYSSAALSKMMSQDSCNEGCAMEEPKKTLVDQWKECLGCKSLEYCAKQQSWGNRRRRQNKIIVQCDRRLGEGGLSGDDFNHVMVIKYKTGIFSCMHKTVC